MNKQSAPQPQQGDLGMGNHQQAPVPANAVQAPTAPVAPSTPAPAKMTNLPPQLVELEQYFKQPKRAFLAAGGTEEQYARETNFTIQALLNNYYLIECAKANPLHFVEAIKNVALTGLTLNPELRLGYLVPYKGKVKFQASYMGKVDILLRTGVVKKIEANLVYSTDKFEIIKGTNGHIKHSPTVPFGDRGELLGGYYLATLTSGVEMFDTMPKARIEEIKSRSESVKAKKSSPWDTDFEEMARKTIINWAFKFLPKTGISDDMVKVLEVESQLDDEMFEDWRKRQPDKSDNFDEDNYTYAEEVKE